MYPPDGRAVPMATTAYVAIVGTVAGPIYSGFVEENLGWCCVQGIQGLSNVPLLIIIALFLDETRGSYVLQQRAKAIRKATGERAI